MRTSKASSPYERTKWVSKYFDLPLYFSWILIKNLPTWSSYKWAVRKESYVTQNEKDLNINVQSSEKPNQTSA